MAGRTERFDYDKTNETFNKKGERCSPGELSDLIDKLSEAASQFDQEAPIVTSTFEIDQNAELVYHECDTNNYYCESGFEPVKPPSDWSKVKPGDFEDPADQAIVQEILSKGGKPLTKRYLLLSLHRLFREIGLPMKDGAKLQREIKAAWDKHIQQNESLKAQGIGTITQLIDRLGIRALRLTKTKIQLLDKDGDAIEEFSLNLKSVLRLRYEDTKREVCKESDVELGKHLSFKALEEPKDPKEPILIYGIGDKKGSRNFRRPIKPGGKDFRSLTNADVINVIEDEGEAREASWNPLGYYQYENGGKVFFKHGKHYAIEIEEFGIEMLTDPRYVVNDERMQELAGANFQPDPHGPGYTSPDGRYVMVMTPGGEIEVRGLPNEGGGLVAPLALDEDQKFTLRELYEQLKEEEATTRVVAERGATEQDLSDLPRAGWEKHDETVFVSPDGTTVIDLSKEKPSILKKKPGRGKRWEKLMLTPEEVEQVRKKLESSELISGVDEVEGYSELAAKRREREQKAREAGEKYPDIPETPEEKKASAEIRREALAALDALPDPLNSKPAPKVDIFEEEGGVFDAKDLARMKKVEEIAQDVTRQLKERGVDSFNVTRFRDTILSLMTRGVPGPVISAAISRLDDPAQVTQLKHARYDKRIYKPKENAGLATEYKGALAQLFYRGGGGRTRFLIDSSKRKLFKVTKLGKGNYRFESFPAIPGTPENLGWSYTGGDYNTRTEGNFGERLNGRGEATASYVLDNTTGRRIAVAGAPKEQQLGDKHARAPRNTTLIPNLAAIELGLICDGLKKRGAQRVYFFTTGGPQGKKPTLETMVASLDKDSDS